MKKIFIQNLQLTGVTYQMAQDVIRDLILASRISTYAVVRDPANPSDNNAVMIHCCNIYLGWVPRVSNAALASAMDAGRAFEAELVKVLEHPRYDTRGIIVNIVEVVRESP